MHCYCQAVEKGGGNNATPLILENIPKQSAAYTVVKNADNQLIVGSKDGLNLYGNTKVRADSSFKIPDISSRKSHLRSESNVSHTEVYALAYQKDGKLLVGGIFGFVNGKVRDSIARLKKDGTLDESFLNTSSGVNGEINDIKVTSNGDIFLGGYFTLFDDVSVPGLVKLNNQGKIIGTSDSLAQRFKLSIVNDIEFIGDEIILGGFFVDENDNESGLIVLNTKDLSINEFKTENFQVKGQVFNTYVHNDNLYIVGHFTKEVFGEIKENIVVLSHDGILSEKNNILPNISGYIYDICIHNEETYLVGNFGLNDLLNQNIFIFNEEGKMVSKAYSSEEIIYSILIDGNQIYFTTSTGLVEKEDLKDTL